MWNGEVEKNREKAISGLCCCFGVAFSCFVLVQYIFTFRVLFVDVLVILVGAFAAFC